MRLNTKLLFELAVYRLDEESYYNEFLKYKNENSTEHTSDSCLINSYGGQWEYNEIVGFLKFYVSGNTQIRCEYHETDKKIKRKTKTKTFIKITDSLCVRSISKKMTNEELINTIEDCIRHCKNNIPIKRFIDTRMFDSTFKNTNWVQVVT